MLSGRKIADECNGMQDYMRMCMVQREVECSAFEANNNNWGLLPPNPQGFRGIGGSSGYSCDLR